MSTRLFIFYEEPGDVRLLNISHRRKIVILLQLSLHEDTIMLYSEKLQILGLKLLFCQTDQLLYLAIVYTLYSFNRRDHILFIQANNRCF